MLLKKENGSTWVVENLHCQHLRNYRPNLHEISDREQWNDNEILAIASRELDVLTDQSSIKSIPFWGLHKWQEKRKQGTV